MPWFVPRPRILIIWGTEMRSRTMRDRKGERGSPPLQPMANVAWLSLFLLYIHLSSVYCFADAVHAVAAARLLYARHGMPKPWKNYAAWHFPLGENRTCKMFVLTRIATWLHLSDHHRKMHLRHDLLRFFSSLHGMDFSEVVKNLTRSENNFKGPSK